MSDSLKQMYNNIFGHASSQTQPDDKKGGKDSFVSDSSIGNEKWGSYYPLKAENWYTAKPYGFKINLRDSDTPITMFLPIGPSNLTITTEFATNIIPTLYGTVEEHSDVRYYDIVIEGTTGMSPQFSQPVKSQPSTAFNTKLNGRKTNNFTVNTNLYGIGSQTINVIRNMVRIWDKGPQSSDSAVNSMQSGYAAFHNLYRILLRYKKDAAGISSGKARKSGRHPLIFFNYKDNNQYYVAIRNFTLRRSAENPMLYYYSIQMRGYQLNKIDDAGSNDELNQRLNNFGLNGVNGSNELGRFKEIARQCKDTVTAALGAISGFGR